jgi:hypothetical protein
MADPLSIVAAVCNELTSTGHTHTPRFEVADEYDFSDFKKQESGYEGVKHEWVRQSGPGIAGDDYQSTVAVPIGGGLLFVVECDT